MITDESLSEIKQGSEIPEGSICKSEGRRSLAREIVAGFKTWDVPAGRGSGGENTQEGIRQVSQTGHTVHTGSGGADGSNADFVADLRGRSTR